jgi:hypothetical protein
MVAVPVSTLLTSEGSAPNLYPADTTVGVCSSSRNCRGSLAGRESEGSWPFAFQRAIVSRNSCASGRARRVQL